MPIRAKCWGPRDMAKPRRRPNMTEKLAASLCEICRNGVWLLPEHLRMNGTAKEICAAVQWDHCTPWTWTHDNRPQNLTPMLAAEHAAKTRRDVKKIAKVRRADKRASLKTMQMAAAIIADGMAQLKLAGKPKRPMQYTAMKGEFKRDFLTGKVVRRT